MVRKKYFRSKLPLFRKSGGEKKKGNYEAFCFSSKHNNPLNSNKVLI